MSDEDSVERRQEEARMRELLQVAMGPDDIPQSVDGEQQHAKDFLNDISDNAGDDEHHGDLIDMNDKSDSQILAVNIGGPKPKKPVKPTQRSDLHHQFSASISSSRDSRMSEQDASMLFGSKRPSYLSGGTDLSDSYRPGEYQEFTKRSRWRVSQYDLTTFVFFIFSIMGALALLITLASPLPVQSGLNLSQNAGPIAVGSSSTADCDDIMTVLDDSIFVDSTALQDEESPQHRAYHWMCNQDTAELDLNDPAFVTRYALAVFFFSTSGRSPMESGSDKTDWTEHSNWLTGAGYCSWFGITCVDEEDNVEVDANGEILQIELSQNFLSGRLPGELSAIKDALGIKLDSNFLYGSIPTEFGRMSSLQDLWLSDNKLESFIPLELGNMVGLRELTLAANQLTGEIPETLSQATHLHYLAVEDNQLKGTIPAVLFRDLTDLETFHVSNNELTGSIPDEVYDMTSLTTLRLSENELSGTISSKLGQLVNLESLHLTDNHFKGEIPDVFSGLEVLAECKLGANEFEGGVPASLGESSALVQLTFEGNELTGEVPEGICSLTETGSLELLTADCLTDIEAVKGTLDLSNVEGAQIIDSGSLSGLTNEEEEVVELEGLICDCCTECF